jgi:hypothetical protein
MDVDPPSLEEEVQLKAYMNVQQMSNYTDPVMWWNQHHLEFPDLVRMTRLYLTVPVTATSHERFFSRVGLVKTDFSVWEHSGHHHD